MRGRAGSRLSLATLSGRALVANPGGTPCFGGCADQTTERSEGQLDSPNGRFDAVAPPVFSLPQPRFGLLGCGEVHDSSDESTTSDAALTAYATTRRQSRALHAGRYLMCRKISSDERPPPMETF